MLYIRPYPASLALVRRSLILVCGIGLCINLAFAAEQDKARWDSKYQSDTYLFGTEPIAFLRDHLDLLPKGKVLDLAMGEGRNGVFLATQGFQVTGVDISERGLAKAKALAMKHGVSLNTVVADLESYAIPANSFDVILCSYYLQRDLFPKIVEALKPEGVAIIETYTTDYRKYRPRFKKAYLLEPNELLNLLPGLRILRYQEVDNGQAAYASILAKKP